MLGRLFKQSNPPASGSSQPQTHSLNPPQTAITHDDLYTREILYASQLLSAKQHLFNPRKFRLLVCQDGGNLRSKQVLFDSAADSGPNSPLPKPEMPKMAQLSLSRNNSAARLDLDAATKLSLSKQSYNINNINDYMFGRGLPTNESCTATKIHYLQQSSVFGNFSAVLVTKLFSVVDVNSSYADKQPGQYDPLWHPAAAFPTKDSFYEYLVGNCRQPGELVRSLFHLRFSIGIIVPLDQDQTAGDILLSQWDVISHYFVILQRVVAKKLILALKYSTVNGICPHINNRRIQFPPQILRGDAELMSQLNKFVRLVFFNANVPRLISSHLLMRHSLAHPEAKFKPLLLNWALEVVNWLEFKDGRNFLNTAGATVGSYLSHTHSLTLAFSRSDLLLSDTFLASLLAVLAPYRTLLSASPMSLDSGLNSGLKSGLKSRKEITRVVIMTGNSAVAKKLIFIINGIIPDTEMSLKLEESDGYEEETSEDKFKNVESETDSTPQTQLSATPKGHSSGVSQSNSSGNPQTPATSVSQLTKTKTGVPASSASTPRSALSMSLAAPQNIPKPPPLISPESAGSSISPQTMAKPIPIKQNSASSNSDESLLVSARSTRGWEIPVKASTSISVPMKKPSFTTETAQAQQIPIHGRNSLSNSLLMAYLSSSLNSSLLSSASNYSLSKLGGSFMEKWKNSLVSNHHSYAHQGFDTPEFTLDLLNKRPLILSLRTPSPAYEYDEPLWESPSQSYTSLSPARQKISRTQSMLDLYNHTLTQKPANEMPAINLKRTMSSVYIPLQSEREQDILAENDTHIKRKCALIMKSRVSYYKVDLTLCVNPTEFNSDGNSVVYDQSTLTSEKSQTLRLTEDLSVPNLLFLHRKCTLLPNVAFVDEFRPEYGVQSCPVNPKLEMHVMNAMKNDLLFFQNNCGYEKVTSRTIFISLRAREIKLIEMKLGTEKHHNSFTGISGPPLAFTSSVTSSAGSSPPNLSFMHIETSPHDRRSNSGNTNYSTTIKKVFSPKNNSGDKAAIKSLGQQLERLSGIVAKINNDGAETTNEDKEYFNVELFETVSRLIS